MSPSGPPGLFKGVTTATSGVIARFPLLLPVRNSVASYGASAVTRDGSKIITNPYLFKEDNKIKEYIYKCSGISGNGQRNYALSKITNEDTLLYYLDDDNIIHPYRCHAPMPHPVELLPVRHQYSVFSNCSSMVTVSPSGPRKLFKGVTNGHFL